MILEEKKFKFISNKALIAVTDMLQGVPRGNLFLSMVPKEFSMRAWSCEGEQPAMPSISAAQCPEESKRSQMEVCLNLPSAAASSRLFLFPR